MVDTTNVAVLCIDRVSDEEALANSDINRLMGQSKAKALKFRSPSIDLLLNAPNGLRMT